MSDTSTPGSGFPQSLSSKCRRQASVLTITLHSLLCAVEEVVATNVPAGSHEHEVKELCMESLNSLIHAFSKDETHIQGDMNVFEALWTEHYVEGFCDVWDSNKGFFTQFPTLEWLKERAEKEGLTLLEIFNGSSIDRDHAAKIADSVPSLPILAISFQGGQSEDDRDWMGILYDLEWRSEDVKEHEGIIRFIGARGDDLLSHMIVQTYISDRSFEVLDFEEVNVTFIPQHV